MFLKEENPEMNNFENLVIKENALNLFLTDTLAKISQNIFAYSFGFIITFFLF